LLAWRRAQEALGVLTVADGRIDAAGEPTFELPAEPAAAEAEDRVRQARLELLVALGRIPG
jgi:hypothetical protein